MQNPVDIHVSQAMDFGVWIKMELSTLLSYTYLPLIHRVIHNKKFKFRIYLFVFLPMLPSVHASSNANPKSDTEDYQRTERISPELVNGYHRNW